MMTQKNNVNFEFFQIAPEVSFGMKAIDLKFSFENNLTTTCSRALKTLWNIEGMLVFNLKAFSDIFHSFSASSLIVLRTKLFCQQYIWKIASQVLVCSLTLYAPNS